MLNGPCAFVVRESEGKTWLRYKNQTGHAEISKGLRRGGTRALVLMVPLMIPAQRVAQLLLILFGLLPNIVENSGGERHGTMILEIQTKRDLEIIWSDLFPEGGN